MDSTKQESISRQSSILKPPKQRQPLQCVAANPSSSESSPTVKIKRRVSFAKNKRIRQFCNEAEEGTIWDNTYEEHDLSNTKNNSNENDHPIIITVPCHDKENFPVQLFLPTDQVECKEIQPDAPLEEGDNLSQCDMEMDSSINNLVPSTADKENGQMEVTTNTTIYCDEGMDMTTYVSSDIIACQKQDFSCFDDTLPVSQSCIEDTCINTTENIPKSVQEHNSKAQSCPNLTTNSTDLTQAISTLLRMGNENKSIKQSNLNIQSNRTDNNDETNCLNSSKTMEFTSVLPSSTWIRPNSECQTHERTKNFTGNTMEFTKDMDNTTGLSEKTNIFSNKSVEMTEPVPIFNKMHQLGTVTETELHEMLNDKTEIFANKSMEITEAIDIRNNLYSNMSMEITEAIPIRNKSHTICGDLGTACHEATQEKTKVFVNSSMEMTETVPIHRINNRLPIDTSKVSYIKNTDKTKNFSNVSMEMTEAVPIYKSIFQPGADEVKLSDDATQNKTKLFCNKLMEITEAIPVSNTDLQSCINLTLGSNDVQEKTKLFCNKSMEITEVIPVYNVDLQSAINSQPISSKDIQDKTNLFCNKSMEITEAISTHKMNPESCINSEEILNKDIQEKTKVFCNTSMEMTEAIPVNNIICQLSTSSDKLLSKGIQENTKLFGNTSMEITEAFSVYNMNRQLCANSLSKGMQEKTKIFCNTSMEMTEAVPVHNANRQSCVSSEKLTSKDMQDKTKLFSNKSMKLTEAFPIYNMNRQSSISSEELLSKSMQEKTKIFCNSSMEMTETVPMHNVNRESCTSSRIVPNKDMQNKTKLLCNTSMEMTEVVSMQNKNQKSCARLGINPSKGMQDKTKLFCNTSMEMTEAVPMYNTNLQSCASSEIIPSKDMQDKTEISCNTSMEMTKAVPINNKIYNHANVHKTSHDITQNMTKHFSNKSMDITEAVPMHNRNHQTFSADVLHEKMQEKTKIFSNASTEVTEAIPVNKIPSSKVDNQKESHNSAQQKSKYFSNALIEMTEAIHNPEIFKPSIVQTEKPCIEDKQDRTNVFINKSMELTEAVPLCNNMNMVQIQMNNPKTILEEKSSEKILYRCEQDKNKSIFEKSMDISKNVSVHLQTISETSKIQRYEAEEKTKISVNRSMDITETISVHQNINRSIKFSQPDSRKEKTKYVSNEGMDIKETIPMQPNNFCTIEKISNNSQEKTRVFANGSMNISHTAPIEQNISILNTIPSNIQNTAVDKTKFFCNTSMNITETVPSHQNVLSNLEANKPIKNAQDKTKIFSNKSMDVTKGIPIQSIVRNLATNSKNEYESGTIDNTHDTISHNFNTSLKNATNIPYRLEMDREADISKKDTNYPKSYDSTKLFDNVSMEFTTMPSMLRSDNRNLQSNQYNNQSILSGRTETVQNSLSVFNTSTKENNYDMSDRFRSMREQTFHRMTSDELNTLCASMNLPTQKYATDESASTQNNFISACNDVNVLRDSLEKNSIFNQQEFSINNDVPSTRGGNLYTPTTSCQNSFKESKSGTFQNNTTMEQSMKPLPKEDSNNILTIMDFSGPQNNCMSKSITMQDNFDTSSNRNNILSKSITTPLIPMDMDKTTEISLKYADHQSVPYSSIQIQNSNYSRNPINQSHVTSSTTAAMHTSFKENEIINNKSINQILPLNFTKTQNFNIQPLNDNSNMEVNMNFSTTHNQFNNASTVAHEQITKNSLTSSEKSQNIQASCIYSENEKLPNSKIQIYHDVSMELSNAPSTSSTAKRKSTEMDEFIQNKKSNASNIVISAHASREFCDDSDKGVKGAVLSRQSSLTRIPSDNTELLLSTMGFKIEQSYPLLINEKIVIKIPNESLVNKNYTIGTNSNEENEINSNNTHVTDAGSNIELKTKSNCLIYQVQKDQENPTQHVEIPTVENETETNELEENSSDKENKKPHVRVNLFPEQHEEVLEEIEPPSFLCSSSIHDESNEKIELIDTIELINELGLLSNSLNKIQMVEQNTNMLASEIEKNEKIMDSENRSSSEKLSLFSSRDSNSVADKIKMNDKSSHNIKVTSREKDSNKLVDKSIRCEIEEDAVEKEPLSPFILLTNDINNYEKRDDCIWSVREIHEKMIALDFITKSFVVVIRLNDIENACIKDIQQIKFISRLRGDSKNYLLKIVHNLLLLKLKPSEILEKYKMYKDILPLLEYISSEVVIAMNFMFDLERLNALNLIRIENERILFIVASKKTNIILKLSLVIKTFSEIGPDDIDVFCILGNIRISDIKQLIVNIKRDYKFLSRYISDVKDYITLMDENLRD